MLLKKFLAITPRSTKQNGRSTSIFILINRTKNMMNMSRQKPNSVHKAKWQKKEEYLHAKIWHIISNSKKFTVSVKHFL